MQVKMIFAEDRPKGETWHVGEIYDAPEDVARRLIEQGRAEPATPIQAIVAEGGDLDLVKVEPKAAPKQSRRGRKK